MQDDLEIAPRFCGPPGSGNGGYVAGLLAAHLAHLDRPLTVRLLQPPPVGVRLTVRATGGESRELVDGDTALAAAGPGALAVAAPDAPGFVDASEVARAFAGFASHPFPGCFVCGPARASGDGLRIFPGAWRDGLVAAPWLPDRSLARSDGRVFPEHVWAALDCPGYFATAANGRPMLLGQMTGRLERAPQVGERCVVVAWQIASEGRKHRVGTAVFGDDGTPCGLAEALWIEPRAALAQSAPSGPARSPDAHAVAG